MRHIIITWTLFSAMFLMPLFASAQTPKQLRPHAVAPTLGVTVTKQLNLGATRIHHNIRPLDIETLVQLRRASKLRTITFICPNGMLPPQEVIRSLNDFPLIPKPTNAQISVR